MKVIVKKMFAIRNLRMFSTSSISISNIEEPNLEGPDETGLDSEEPRCNSTR